MPDTHRVNPVAANPLHLDTDAGIPDLIRRLTDDGKRLVAGEIRLAKIETTDHVGRAGRGGLRLTIAFGIGVVALVAFTVLVATLIGRLVNGHMWLGAVVAGLFDLVFAVFLPQSASPALPPPAVAP